MQKTKQSMSIQAARERLNLTQTDFAVRCETTQAAVSKIEAGEQKPPLRMVKFIGEKLGCAASQQILNYYGIK